MILFSEKLKIITVLYKKLCNTFSYVVNRSNKYEESLGCYF